MKLRAVVAIGSVVTVGLVSVVVAHERTRGRAALPPVTQPTWVEGCGGCHLLYPPGLLPARSWRAIVAGASSHFGQDLDLTPEASAQITTFLVDNAADHSVARLSRKIMKRLRADETPVRVTQAAWFLRKHDDVSPEVWRRDSVGGAGNCRACHPQATAGDYNEHDVRIPD